LYVGEGGYKMIDDDYFDKVNKKIDQMTDDEINDLLVRAGLDKCPQYKSVLSIIYFFLLSLGLILVPMIVITIIILIILTIQII
jgi:hypothetical protein